MEGNRVSKSEFEVRALELFRQIEASGESIVITDHGIPTLEVRPYRVAERNPLDVLRGSVVHFDDPLAPIDEGFGAYSYVKAI
jgi:antitoxin (DNA-binding transcriptional repressor) of toxin-antitoxin stability system